MLCMQIRAQTLCTLYDKELAQSKTLRAKICVRQETLIPFENTTLQWFHVHVLLTPTFLSFLRTLSLCVNDAEM